MDDSLQIRIMDIMDGTVVDGPGFRLSVYSAGCSHNCPGCHNPQSWNILNGKLYTVGELLDIVKESPWNVTFSGGDPFFQAKEFAYLAMRIRQETSKTIWCYTGYLIEDIITSGDTNMIELLKNVDTLVDGPFVEALKSINLPFRGSSNQRILEREAIERMLVQ